MRRIAIIVPLTVVVLLALAQLVRPDRSNPPTEPSRALAAQAGVSRDLITVLDRSCKDCHSNETVWTWHAQVAPLSWVIVSGVKYGRHQVNFSEWGAYPAERRRALLRASCIDATNGTMPGNAWVWLHSEARLSAEDIKTICTAADELDRAGRKGP